jgi:hypothetical protein
MADIKISALGAAAALGGGELLAGVQGGGNVAITPAQLLSYMLGAPATAEAIQDATAALLTGGSGIAISYDDAGNALTIASTAAKAVTASGSPAVTSDSSQGYAPGSRWTSTSSGIGWTCLDASAGAAQWSPAGALAHPGYVPGFYYAPVVSSAPLSGVAMAADTLTAVPILIGQRCTAAAIALRITAAVAGNARLGLYANAGGPTKKIAEGAVAPSTGSTGVIEVALATSTTLLPGVYWLAAQFSAAPSVFGVATAERGLIGLIGSSGASTLLTGGGIAGVYATGGAPYAGGLPSDFGAWAEASSSPRVPMLVLKAG